MAKKKDTVLFSLGGGVRDDETIVVPAEEKTEKTFGLGLFIGIMVGTMIGFVTCAALIYFAG